MGAPEGTRLAGDCTQKPQRAHVGWQWLILRTCTSSSRLLSSGLWGPDSSPSSQRTGTKPVAASVGAGGRSSEAGTAGVAFPDVRCWTRVCPGGDVPQDQRWHLPRWSQALEGLSSLKFLLRRKGGLGFWRILVFTKKKKNFRFHNKSSLIAQV